MQGHSNKFTSVLTGESRRDSVGASAAHALGANLVADDAPSQVTKLLQGWRAGERSASDALLPLVYDELRRLAHHHLRNERPHHTATEHSSGE